MDSSVPEFLKFMATSSVHSLEKDDEPAYKAFCALRVSHRANVLLQTIFVIGTSYVFAMSALAPNSGTFLRSVDIMGGLIINPMLLGSIIWRYRFNMAVDASFSSNFMNLMAVCTTLILGMHLIARVRNGECANLDEFHRWSCNPEHSAHTLPQGSVLLLMFLPLIYSVALKTIPVTFVIFSWVIVVISLVVAIVATNGFVAVPVVVVYVPLSLTCMYEIHRQNVFLFLVLKKQQGLLDSNKQLAEETHTDLRFMIANMAHDLKTVSTFKLLLNLHLININFSHCLHS